jgi:hypothetical protein
MPGYNPWVETLWLRKRITKMTQEQPSPRSPDLSSERRHGPDRRKNTVRSLIYGSFVEPRRRGPRRDDQQASFTAVDWHQPQWLAVGLSILLLSFADAVLTLTLLNHGAIEANPLMRVLIDGSGLGFATVKIGLTAGGTVLLILLAQMRAFGRIPIGAVLYAVLAAYVALISYELWLLEEIT